MNLKSADIAISQKALEIKKIGFGEFNFEKVKNSLPGWSSNSSEAHTGGSRNGIWEFSKNLDGKKVAMIKINKNRKTVTFSCKEGESQTGSITLSSVEEMGYIPGKELEFYGQLGTYSIMNGTHHLLSFKDGSDGAAIVT